VGRRSAEGGAQGALDRSRLDLLELVGDVGDRLVGVEIRDSSIGVPSTTTSAGTAAMVASRSRICSSP
jgi:hypothetical protein